MQSQYDAMVRTKAEVQKSSSLSVRRQNDSNPFPVILNIQVDEKCSVLSRENNELKSHIEEDEEEMNTLLQKSKTTVAQVGCVCQK